MNHVDFSSVGDDGMSQKSSTAGPETLPPKPGDWEGDTRFWMKVGCNLESTGSDGFKVVKVSPLAGWMNFSIWNDATRYDALDLEESEWRSFVFTHANHLSDLESATLLLYQDNNYFERDILPDLSGDWKTLEYLLPSASPEGQWKNVGSPTKIKYILFKFSGKSGKLSGSFEIRNAHLIRAPPKAESVTPAPQKEPQTE